MAGQSKELDQKLAHAICGIIAKIKMDLWVHTLHHKLHKEWVALIREEKEEPQKVKEQRLRALQLIRQIKERTAKANAELVSREAPEHLKKVLATARTRNVLALRELIELSGSPDKSLPDDILYGFPTIGDAPRTGLWEPNEKEMEEEAKNVGLFYGAAIKLRKHAPAGFPESALKQIIKNIEEDVLLGRYRGIDVADLKTNPAYTFPKVEPEKVRVIVDERAKNAFSRLTEKVKLAGTRLIAELIAAYTMPKGMEADANAKIPQTQAKKELAINIAGIAGGAGAAAKNRKESRAQAWRKATASASAAAEGWKAQWKKEEQDRMKPRPRGVLPEMASRDWAKAYYQVGVQSPEENPVAAFCPERGEYRLYVAAVLNMGNKHSVTSWCRVAEAVMRIACRVGKVVSPVYIDDGTILACKGELELACEIYEEISDCLGLEMSSKAASNQSSEKSNRVRTLGIIYVWCREEESIQAAPPEETYVRLDTLIDKAVCDVDNKDIKHKELQSLVGVACHITVASDTRAGAELLRGLYDWVSEEGFQAKVKARNERNSLRKALLALKQVAAERRPLKFKVLDKPRGRVTVITDASSDGGPAGEPAMAALLVDGEGHMKVATATAAAGERIEVLEARAVAMAVATFEEELRNKDVIILVDNVVALYALMKCSSRSAGTQKEAIAAVRGMHKIGCKAFYTYVPSELNVADFFTREDKRETAQKILQPDQREAKFPATESNASGPQAAPPGAPRIGSHHPTAGTVGPCPRRGGCETPDATSANPAISRYAPGYHRQLTRAEVREEEKAIPPCKRAAGHKCMREPSATKRRRMCLGSAGACPSAAGAEGETPPP